MLNDVAVEQAPAPTDKRRVVPRTAAAHDRSRLVARRMQGAFVLAGAMCFTLVVGSVVQGAVPRPMAAISMAMTGAPAAAN